MAKNSRNTNSPNDEFWPHDVENIDALQPLIDVSLDTAARTLPNTLPSIAAGGRPQRFASWVPIAVNDAVAKELLQYNTVNRKISEANVDRLTDAILRGAWMFNGLSSMLVCSNGAILNAQHTLRAIIRAHEIAAAKEITLKPILMVPIIGLDPAVFATIDDGRGRAVRDTLTVAEKAGLVSLNDVADNECSTALRVMLQYVNMVQDIKPDDPLYLEGLRSKVPNYRAAELLGYFPQLTESLAFCNGISAFHARRPIISIAIGGALHAIISEVQSTTAANNFVKSLITGTNLDETSPIYKLREQMINDQGRKIRAEAIEKLAMCIRAWNMVATHRAPPSKGRIKALGNKDGFVTFPIPVAMQRRRPGTIVR